jgi:hypothetical protein
VLGISTDFETRLEQANTNTQLLVNELADQISDHRSEVDANLAKLGQDVDSRFTHQKESLEKIAKAATREKSTVDHQFGQVKEKLGALEDKFCGLPSRQHLAADALEIGHGTNSPSVVRQNDQSSVQGGITGNKGVTSGNGSCSFQSNHCNALSNDAMHACSVNGPTELLAVPGFLSNSELPLPLFDDATDTNVVFHLQRLDEFIKFKNVLQALQLAVACRSISGQMSKQWIEAASRNLTDYQSFRTAFLNTWWSSSCQSLVRCSLYQSKYNRQSNLSLSGHFLKYATMATYLDPRPSDSEIVEALRYHFPTAVQQAMLTNRSALSRKPSIY